MRELTQSEISDVNGGAANVAAFFALGGAYTLGERIGEAVNYVNRTVSGMSLGEAMYYSFNSK